MGDQHFVQRHDCTGHGLRLPAEIAAGWREFPAGNEIGDLYMAQCRMPKDLVG